METSINNQSGGTAAQTNTNPNPNQTMQNQTMQNQTMQNQTNKTEPDDELVTIKAAAEKFECAATTIKYNIKHGKLPAYQSHPKAAYMVRLSEVESFLRDNPNIASIFHPAADKPAGPVPTRTVTPSNSVPAKPEVSLAAENKPETKPPVVQATPAPVETATKTAKPSNDEVDHKQATGVPDVQADPSTQVPADGTKRRRRRRRGKGGGGTESPATVGIRPPVLRALAGTTPQERLRITACLTELLGLVASA